MNYDSVIFDLDGTLLDTLEDLSDAANAVLAQFGFPVHPTAAFRQMVGRGLRVLVTEALPEASRASDTVQRVHDALDGYLRGHPVTKTKPYPEVPELLSSLQNAGIAMGILTNKPDALTHLVVARLLGRWPFVGVYGQRENVPRKPDPTVAIALSSQMGSAPARTLFVGDSDVDMETARAARMTAVGAAWGFRGADELRAAGAEHLISGPLELLKVLGVEQSGDGKR